MDLPIYIIMMSVYHEEVISVVVNRCCSYEKLTKVQTGVGVGCVEVGSNIA